MGFCDHKIMEMWNYEIVSLSNFTFPEFHNLTFPQSHNYAVNGEVEKGEDYGILQLWD